jgi:hypothetical protein
MEISEKEFEDFIFNDLVNNGGSNLIDRGLLFKCFNLENQTRWFRQLNIDPYGICDIVGFTRHQGKIFVELIELKKTSIDCNHFEQICKYKKGLEVYLTNTLRLGSFFTINMTLVGIGYGGNYIQNMLPVDVYSATFDLNGFDFELHKAYSVWHCPSGKHKSFRNGKKIY